MSVYIIIIVLLFLDLLMEESSVLPVINVMFGDRVLLPCSNVSQLSSDQVGYSLSLPPSLPPSNPPLPLHTHTLLCSSLPGGLVKGWLCISLL